MARARHVALGKCSYCGKQTYSTRKRAKLAIRRNHPGDSRLAAYECQKAMRDGCRGFWHVGHLYPEIVHGQMGRMRK